MIKLKGVIQWKNSCDAGRKPFHGSPGLKQLIELENDIKVVVEADGIQAVDYYQIKTRYSVNGH